MICELQRLPLFLLWLGAGATKPPCGECDAGLECGYCLQLVSCTFWDEASPFWAPSQCHSRMHYGVWCEGDGRCGTKAPGFMSSSVCASGAMYVRMECDVILQPPPPPGIYSRSAQFALGQGGGERGLPADAPAVAVAVTSSLASAGMAVDPEQVYGFGAGDAVSIIVVEAMDGSGPSAEGVVAAADSDSFLASVGSELSVPVVFKAKPAVAWTEVPPKGPGPTSTAPPPPPPPPSPVNVLVEAHPPPPPRTPAPEIGITSEFYMALLLPLLLPRPSRPVMFALIVVAVCLPMLTILLLLWICPGPCHLAVSSVPSPPFVPLGQAECRTNCWCTRRRPDSPGDMLWQEAAQDRPQEGLLPDSGVYVSGSGLPSFRFRRDGGTYRLTQHHKLACCSGVRCVDYEMWIILKAKNRPRTPPPFSPSSFSFLPSWLSTEHCPDWTCAKEVGRRLLWKRDKEVTLFFF